MKIRFYTKIAWFVWAVVYSTLVWASLQVEPRTVTLYYYVDENTSVLFSE